jgi:hypothetical protein
LLIGYAYLHQPHTDQEARDWFARVVDDRPAARWVQGCEIFFIPKLEGGWNEFPGQIRVQPARKSSTSVNRPFTRNIVVGLAAPDFAHQSPH